MKNFAAFFLIVFLVTLNFTAQATTDPAPQDFAAIKKPIRWEKLGTRKVNYRLDRDEVLVTAREGRFTKLRLQVNNGGINLHRVVVHFANGQTQVVKVNRSIPAGGQSGTLDLKGDRRVISKVVFYYDTKNFSGRKANVVLWGRH
ncbi:MAG: hypothetical protein AAFZ15_11205 [Bacteroidota bacterium]